jgi:ferredoxin-NADP reductase/MOSC domain-containing protein YiiM
VAVATLVSVNVGMPADVAWRGRTVHTGVWKRPVDGRRLVRRLNIDGDGQGDLAGHGGEQRAVMVYQLDSYRHWREFFGLDDLEHGAFGENFTVDGLNDDEVCIGDRFAIGDAEFEVTQPRVTCFRVGMRMGQPRLPSLLVAHHRPGFYLRVISEGYVAPGDEIVRTARGPHEMTVADVDALLYLPGPDRGLLEAAVDIPALSPGWQGSFQAMLTSEPGSGTRSPGGVQTGAAPGWAGFRTLEVSQVVEESAAITSYYLTAGDGEALPRPTPGQYLTLRVPDVADPAPVRTYSLSGDPGQARYRISVKRESLGLVSPYLRAHLSRGDRVEAAAPRGTFVLDDGSDPVLLVSAGIGVTPVLAMLYQLAAPYQLTQRAGTRDVWWIHTTHDAGSHVFAAEAAELLAALPSARSLVFYTSGGGSVPRGVSVGRLTADVIAGLGVPRTAQAYVCGPESFMDDVTAALGVVGLDARQVHTERFGTRSAINPGIVPADVPPPHQPPGPPGTGPEVTFARSGLSVAWSDDYPTVLELAEACDVPTQWSCRSGVCHTCVTALLSGDTSYTTDPLEPPGPSEVLICCARPGGDIVLDL